MRPAPIFNGRLQVVEGWYWVIRSGRLKRGKSKAVSVMGRDLVVYRTELGEPRVFDAYCPHMGCHLSLGKVEGDCIRCFFHNWRFNGEGVCDDVPSLDRPPSGVHVRKWTAVERHGLIWVWTGAGDPDHEIPEPVELAGTDYDFAVGKSFHKKCHPNVVMINAIDEQHFRTVHHIPGHLLHMKPERVDARVIRFRNTARLPDSDWLFRFASRFYAGPVRYELQYWYGSNGLVTLGPDFLHLYIIFALRQTPDKETEGQTLVFTRRRKGPLGWLVNRLVLWLTRIAGNYFSRGDTKVFQNIRFHYRTPVSADRAVQAFIAHLNKQPLADWVETDGR